jgi:hypothetical protein
MTRRLLDCVKHTNLELSHHRAFWEAVEAKLPPGSLANDGELGSLWLSAVPDQPDAPNTWEGVSSAAKAAGSRYPELVAAQWALESGWGKHTSGKNNYFGLKGTGSEVNTKEFINGEWVTIKAGFIDFPSLVSCVTYLVDRWYKDYKDFHGVNRAPDQNAAARMLVSEGYATDPQYAEKLIKLMEDAAPLSPSKPTGFGNPLSVPWYAQLDSATDQGRRMCFSSSCAMMLSFLKPGVLTGPNGDDQYLKRVQQYGDTTDARAHVHALSSYGVNARFVQNANFELIEQQINKGVPVPCGYLHRGPVDAPSGGGHWLCVVGYDKTNVIVHDPIGESDLIGGATLNSVARYAKYSRKNFGKRWMVELVNGVYRYAPNKGWAIIAER